MKPPLNISFSGYRPSKVLKGFGMMRAMGESYSLFWPKTVDPSIWAQKVWKSNHCLIDQHLTCSFWAKRYTWFVHGDLWCPFYYGALYSLLMWSWSENPLSTWGCRCQSEINQMSSNVLDMMQLIIGQVSQEGSVSGARKRTKTS